nr:hypothetical protein [Tanacetum cinerariifolium]
MDNLPDSLYVDYADGSSSSSNAAPPNNAGSATSALSATERPKIGWLIPLVNLPHTRSEAITQLNNIFQKNKITLMIISQIRKHHVDNDKDPEVRTTSELFALACGPTWTPISINSCIVEGVRYVVHSRDERHITQNSGICSPGPNEEMYYGQLQEILEFKYLLFKVVLFRVKWFDTHNQGLKQVFYLEDKAKPYWRVVEHVNHKKFSDGGVIVVEDDSDIIHFDNSYDLLLSTSLNDLDNATLHIDGQSTEVDIPPNIINVVDEDDDITDDEDVLPHDLADFDNEDLINMSADVVQSHDGDGRGEDRPLHTMYPAVARVALLTEAKANESLIWAIGQQNTCDKTQNLSLKEITDTKGPRQTSSTQEYPSLIDTLFVAHTVNGKFLQDEDQRMYKEMRRLEAMGTYIDDEINCLASGGKQRGHILSVVGYCHLEPQPAKFESGGASRSGGCRDEEEGANHQDDEDKDGDGDT